MVLDNQITKEEMITKLKEFDRFAEEVFNLRFIKRLQEGLSCKISFNKEVGIATELLGPDDDELKAFISDIRRFFQKGDDSLKIHRLIPIYKSGLVEDSEKKIFNEEIRRFDWLKEQKTSHTINGIDITYSKVLEVFLYGRYSHRTNGTKEIHDEWEKIPPMYIWLKFEFINALSGWLQILNNITYANNLVLGKLKEDETRKI